MALLPAGATPLVQKIGEGIFCNPWTSQGFIVQGSEKEVAMALDPKSHQR